MPVTFQRHPAFQRATLTAVAAALALTLAALWLALPRGLSYWSTTAAALAVLTLAAAVAPVGRLHRLAAAAALLGAALLAGYTARALAPGDAPLGQLTFAALYALVASLGLLPLHLGLEPDPVGQALAAAGATVDPPERAVCLRAAAAEAAIRTALAQDPLPDARALRRLARDAARQGVTVASKVHRLAAAAARVDRAALAERLTLLASQEARTHDSDPESARQYARAASAIHDQQAHLDALATAADRLRAHLHGQVTALETTALALAVRGGAVAAAGQAAGLAPLCDRLREVAAQAQAEAAALVDGGV